jgi:hypothetical protein
VEGGVDNDYGYVSDPRNEVDLSGEYACHSWDAAGKVIRRFKIKNQLKKRFSGSWLTIRITCGEGGRGGYGIRHFWNASSGQNHQNDINNIVVKYLGHGLNKETILDQIVVAAIASGRQVYLANSDQVKITAWQGFFDFDTSGRMYGCGTVKLNIYLSASTLSLNSVYPVANAPC